MGTSIVAGLKLRRQAGRPRARVAVVAERSDREALSSYVYFVLVGDHVFSPSELRAAYYRHRVVFAAASDCVSVRWSDTHNLTVMCGNGAIDAEHIELQQQKRKMWQSHIKTALRENSTKWPIGGDLSVLPS